MLLSLIALGAAVGSSASVTLVSHPRNGALSVSDVHAPRRIVANQFKVPGANGIFHISKITWWGTHMGFDFQPAGFFAFFFINDVNGLPSGFAGGGGVQIVGVPEADGTWRYEETTTQFSLQLGKTYWFDVNGQSFFGEIWQWSGSDFGSGHSMVSNTGYYEGYVGAADLPNYAFQIEGEIELTGTPKISGTVALQDYAGPMPKAKIEVIQNGSVVETFNDVTLDGAGHFSVDSTKTGSAQLRISAPHFLAKTLDVTLGFDSVEVYVPLTNGDIDGDNSITVFDYGILSDYFDLTMESPNWTTIGPNGFAPKDADLDGDGAVSVFDYGIISNGFDRSGD